jgi:hypothetical protein
MARDPEAIAHQEWLGYVQPVGLVVSIPALLAAHPPDARGPLDWGSHGRRCQGGQSSRVGSLSRGGRDVTSRGNGRFRPLLSCLRIL